jgi:superfamily I DNA/RNA helicase
VRWPELRQSDSQLAGELDFINEGLFADEAAYLAAARTGRGFALRPADRSQVWALHQAVTQTLRDRGLRMWSALPRELCLTDRARTALPTYEHILVDEAQFFAPSWFQAVKLSLAAGGQLFMCADPNQGFMKSRLSWKSVGLDVAGRTKRLRRSYRTTRALLEAATDLLALMGCSAHDDYLLPDYRGMEAGSKPLLAYTASPQDAIDRLASELAALTDGGRIPLSAFLVIYGDKVHKQALHTRLARQFGAGRVWWFNDRDQKKEPPQGYGRDYLRMAYLETATGLEASFVFLVGIEDLFFTGNVPGLDDEEMAELREENARKFYMAMTRAGQKLVVLASQRLPQAMESLFDAPSPVTPMPMGHDTLGVKFGH